MKKVFQSLKFLLLAFIVSSFFYGNSIKAMAMTIDEAREIVEAYKTLGVGQNATLNEIDKARRDLQLKWHPDKCDTKQYTKKFCEEQAKKINNAHDVIKDNWDKVQSAWLKYGKMPPPTPTPAVSKAVEAAKIADGYIEKARKALTPKDMIDYYNQAIETLRPHTPETSAKILKTYVEWIKALISSSDFFRMDFTLQRAQSEQEFLAKKAGHLEKFRTESENLKTIETLVFATLAREKPDSALEFALRDLNIERVKQVIDRVTDEKLLFQTFWLVAGRNQPNAALIIELMRNKTRAPFIDINNQGPRGPTALMYAAQEGSLETIQELLKFPNIDVNKQNVKDSNKTALDYAHERKDQKIINALKNAGAKTNQELQQK